MKILRKKLLVRLLLVWKKRKQRSVVLTTEHCLATVRAMLRQVKYSFLITHGLDQWNSARLVQPILDKDEAEFVFWIMTNDKLRKAQEIRQNNFVTLALQSRWDFEGQLILHGTARFDYDLEKRKLCWRDDWVLFFPDGVESKGAVLLIVEVSRIEIMNIPRSIIPEPFCLSSITLIKDQGIWKTVAESAN
ncbi:MAG: pyridoxamine 5'-phosphate oxidase family protein [Acidiferrobacterales bacterium]